LVKEREKYWRKERGKAQEESFLVAGDKKILATGMIRITEAIW
jgi:hypothetical protein